MNKTATILRSTLAALLVGALSVPGLALARDHDRHGGDGYRSKHHERHHGGHRHGQKHGHRRHRERVVVVHEPVYLAPRPAVVSAPLWGPLTGGITMVLGTRW